MRPLSPVALAAWTLYALDLVNGCLHCVPLLALPAHMAVPIVLVLPVTGWPSVRLA